MREKIAQKPVSSDFSPKEATIIKEAKSKTALQFLAEIKQTRKGTITQTERELLQQMAGLGLLDEVINIILLLTFNKVDSANINEKYAMKVANDYAYQKGDVYQLALHAPLSSKDFLEHPVYRRLLEKKIGDAAVEDLGVESADGQEIPVSLNQVFPDLAELGSQEDLSLKKKVANDFDLDHFRQLMARDGLRFADEQSDVLNLFAIAEE